MNHYQRILNIIFFVLIFFYFSLKLFITFDFEINFKEEKHSLSMELKNGLIQKYNIEKKIYAELDSDFLEREHIPQRLFLLLSQDIKKNLFSIFIILFLDILILLFLYALYHNLTFTIPFQKLLLILILMILFINLYFVERYNISEKFQIYQNYFLFFPLIWDSILIFICTWLLFEHFDLNIKKPFLDFYYSKTFVFKTKLIQLTLIFRDLTFLSLISVFVVNLFLLPIYYAQISYKIPFEGIFIAFLVFLIVFYVYAYYYVSKNREENPKMPFAISFLGFKILKNLFQFIVFLIFIISIGMIATLFIIANLNVLETLKILQESKGL
jgi:hypothetical protein